MIDKPCHIIVGGLIFLFILGGISFGLGYFDMNDQTERDFLIWDNEVTIAYDKMLLGEEYLLKQEGSAAAPLQLTPKKQWNPILIYESADGKSLLEKARL
jgi:hypothetical protein